MDVKIMTFGNRVLGVIQPNTVELTVVETEPGIKGDTATGGEEKRYHGHRLCCKKFLCSSTKATFWLSIPVLVIISPVLNFFIAYTSSNV